MTLSADGVSKHYDGVVALDGVSLSFEPGVISAIVGPNGSGKSTLFDVMTGVVQRDKGDLSLQREPIDTRRVDLVARRGIVRTYQVPRVAASMTVLENLMVVAPDAAGDRLGRLVSPLWWSRVRADEAARRESAMSLLQTLGLAHMANELAGTLSGGQKKLVSTAAALTADPPVLLLDEPTAGVSPIVIKSVVELLRQRRQDRYITVLIEHNLGVVSTLCDDVYVLDTGRVIAHGHPEEIKVDPQVVSAYLGKRQAVT
jgi:ABC-type branched-subunit amino acid transport system ATPase component